MKIKSYDYTYIGKRIQQARKARGYTQEELAEIIDMSVKNVSRLENGTVGFSIPTLDALSKALEVSTDYILFGDDGKNLKNTVNILLSKLPEQKQLQAEKVLRAFVDAYTD